MTTFPVYTNGAITFDSATPKVTIDLNKITQGVPGVPDVLTTVTFTATTSIGGASASISFEQTTFKCNIQNPNSHPVHVYTLN